MCAATARLKIRYETEEIALAALEDARNGRRRGRGRYGVEKRVYECESCGGWHLTHMA